jgi:hypothetical protein
MPKRKSRLLSTAEQSARSAKKNTEQHARFVEAAKQAEADSSPDAMDRAFKRINLTKPSDRRSRPSSKRSSA